MTKRKSVGRPRQDAEPGERAQLSFRVTAELKRRLDAAADESGRSQSQEAEFRLERSFDRQDLLSEVQRLLGPIAERMRREYDRANPILATEVQPGGSMATHSNWKGHLRLSLVSVSIAINPATSSSENVGFNTSNRTIDMEKFVPKTSIDDRYRDTPYYLVPVDAMAGEGYAVIRAAMENKKVVAIARVATDYSKRIMMLETFGKGIVGTLLHYPCEILSEAAVFQKIPDFEPDREMTRLAEELIEKKIGDFEPEKFEDRSENAAKPKGPPAPKEEATARSTNVINLMDALRRSTDDFAA
jgi:DNA end-binding protein Ku